MNPTETLILDGPRVAATLSTVDDRHKVEVTLLVDTGADRCVIDETIVEALGSTPASEAQIAGVTSSEPLWCPVHALRLRVAGVAGAFDINAIELPRANDAVDGLLGRDVLGSLRFTYNGPAGLFTIAR